jgi:hypothetical protein
VQVAVDTVLLERALIGLRSRALDCSELAFASGRLGAPIRAVEIAGGLAAFTRACTASFALLAADVDLLAATVAAAADAYQATETGVIDLAASASR